MSLEWLECYRVSLPEQSGFPDRYYMEWPLLPHVSDIGMYVDDIEVEITLVSWRAGL